MTETTTKQELITLANTAKELRDNTNRELKRHHSEVLLEHLAGVGIYGELDDKLNVLIARRYIATGDSRKLYLSCEGFEQRVGFNTAKWTQDKNIKSAIGEAIQNIDQRMERQNAHQAEPAYMFVGDTLGEILEQVMREMLAESTEYEA